MVWSGFGCGVWLTFGDAVCGCWWICDLVVLRVWACMV